MANKFEDAAHKNWKSEDAAHEHWHQDTGKRWHWYGDHNSGYGDHYSGAASSGGNALPEWVHMLITI